MLGRLIKIAAVAGAGTLAYRWWQNKQAEDREYATGGGTNAPASAGAAGSTSAGARSGAAGTTGTASPMGMPVNQVPAQ